MRKTFGQSPASVLTKQFPRTFNKRKMDFMNICMDFDPSSIIHEVLTSDEPKTGFLKDDEDTLDILSEILRCPTSSVEDSHLLSKPRSFNMVFNQRISLLFSLYTN